MLPETQKEKHTEQKLRGEWRQGGTSTDDDTGIWGTDHYKKAGSLGWSEKGAENFSCVATKIYLIPS